MSPQTVAIIVNDDEMELSKKMLSFLKTQLSHLNFEVKESCISNDIVETVKNWSKSCDILLITGKIALISNVLSSIFNEKLIISNHLASVYNMTVNSNTHKIVLPNSAVIFQIQDHANGINPVCVKYRNIFILPDDVLSVKFILNTVVTSLIRNANKENYCKRYVLKCDQNGRAISINEEIRKISNLVHVMNYCILQDDMCQLNLIVNSSDFNKLLMSEDIIKKMVPNAMMLSESISDHFWDGLTLLKDGNCVRQAIEIITKCYTDYQPQDIFLSFNGGKDCTVLLYLTVYILKKLHPNYQDKLLCLYIQSEHPFKEVEDFIEQCKMFYNLEVIVIKNSVKVGLAEILKEKTNLKACLIGTRRTDPYSEHLKHFQMTDTDWPEVMRVSPILDWNYSEIWEFLLKCKIPYCHLYDLGYTSLGSKTNTNPNPALKMKNNHTGEEYFLPAYKLEDGSKERCGRFKF